jgi:hypothetical protein
MAALSVIIHERVANWSRQLRPRFPGWPIRWSETRSEVALVRAAARSTCPIVVIELDRRNLQGLRDLHEALQVTPNALSMVLEPLNRPDVATIARELGATLVLPGVVVPPEVERLLLRWLPIAKGRSEAEGWSASSEPEPEFWEQPDLFPWPDQPIPIGDEPD